MQKLVKICGIKSASNFEALKNIDVDMVGLNFYEPSVRYIDTDFKLSLLNRIPAGVKRVGVFVDASFENIMEQAIKFDLNCIQLHGNEKPQFVLDLCNEGLHIIKAFQLSTEFSWSDLDSFVNCKYYLFDNKTKNYGGSGKKFNWNLLNDYTGSIPFLLSGGIGPNDLTKISELNHTQYAGIDINSLFESSPGIKNMALVRDFVEKFKTMDS